MSADTLFVFAVLAFAVVLFASDRVRLDIVALGVLLALMLGGILTVQEALAGFSDPVVLMIAGLFVVGEALVSTGIAFAIGRWLMRVGGSSETRLIALIMSIVAVIGAFMSSTGIVAIFIPIVLSIAGKTGLPAGRLMMPLGFAALISGMMTLIATPPNLVVNAELRNAGLATFGFFAFTPFGVAILACGLVYMLTVGRRLLGRSSSAEPAEPSGRTLEQLADGYALLPHLRRVRVQAGSALADRTIGQAELRSRFGLVALGVERRDRRTLTIMPALVDTAIRFGDILYVLASDEELEKAAVRLRLTTLGLDTAPREHIVQELGLAEVMLAPESKLIGRTLPQAAFRSRHRVSVLGIKRMGEPLTGSLADVKLSFGDTLLVSGRWRDIGRLQGDKKDFVVLHLPLEISEVAPARSRATWALAILLAMIAAMTFGLIPNVGAVLFAALLLVLSRCVTMDAAYKVINWPSLVLIAGMLPLATALQKTGGTDLIVNGLVAAVGGAGPEAMMAALFVLTAVIGMFVSNTATAVLLAPIAIGAAADLDVSPYPFVMAVALAASAAFMTPVSSPVNTLVMTPGGYGFIDFVKIGVPMTVVTGAVALVMVPLLLPF